MEKKRAEREQQRLVNKKQLGNRPKEEEDIIGNLMKEIRAGKALRRHSEAPSAGSTQLSRQARELNQGVISTLPNVQEQSFTESTDKESEDTDSSENESGDNTQPSRRAARKLNQDDVSSTQKDHEQSLTEPIEEESVDTTDGSGWMLSDYFRCDIL